MLARRHLLFNISIILFPWLSLLLLGKQNVKRFSISGISIIIFEILNHMYGHKRKWWKFYDKKDSFLWNELPFSIGPYMPLSMWLLKIAYGNLPKFLALNAFSDGLFAFFGMDLLKKLKIIRLNRLNRYQFFLYLFYKVFILYGVQYLVEKRRSVNE